MNGKLPPLALWLLGALLVFNIALVGFLWDSVNERMDRIETKVDAVQREYGRIAGIDARLDRIERTLDSLLAR